MSNLKNIVTTTAAAALLFSGSAFAATAFAAPAAGEAPFFDDTAVSSQLQRGDVETQAAANLPAAGEFSAHAADAHATSGLTRAEVEASISRMPAAGNAA